MLKNSIDFIFYDALHLSATSRLYTSINFFIYDSIKIILMLYIFISIIGFLRSFISQAKIKNWIEKKNKITGHLFAALFGAVTPFCSCSSIPLFLSFLKSGVPLGISFSFLITSPILNEYLFVLMAGYFGLKIAIAYAVSGITIGIVAGLILGRMNLEKYLEKDFTGGDILINDKKFPSMKSRLIYGLQEGWSIVVNIWKWVLAGVLMGALIHNYIPDKAIHDLVNAGGIFAVPLATIIGVPIYGSCAAIVPIAVVLFNKGVPLGTTLAFMMAVSALSLPEAVILRSAMKLRLIGVFYGIVTLGIIFTGYLFNILSNLLF